MSRYSSGSRRGGTAARPLFALLAATFAATAVAAGTTAAHASAAPVPGVRQPANDVGWNSVGSDSGRIH
ncbi:hypothetical protein ACFYNM_00855 [Streptomyces spororaveus]|uniref:hypothetical protein n=1 Tax=Streptomyces spororaveus TaxID=284039 RepID=UPI0036937E7F